MNPNLFAFGIGSYFNLLNELDFLQYILMSFFAIFLFGNFHLSAITNRVILGAILFIRLDFVLLRFVKANYRLLF